MNVAQEWYYVDGGNQQQGPVDAAAIRDLLASKAIDMDTFFWTEGQPDWIPLNDLPALKSKVTVAAPAKRNAPPAPPRPASRGGGGRPMSIRAAQDATKFGYGSAPTVNMKSAPGAAGGFAAAAPRTGGTWHEKLTADGVPYYYNSTTEAVCWDKPDALKSASELETDSGEWVWVSDPDEGWLPARVLSKSAASASVQLQNGQRKNINTKNEPMWPLTLSSLTRLEDDLVMVDAINQGLMMYCLKERYKRDQIYTWVGANHSVLVSVNPFKQLPIYTVNVMKDFAKPSPNRLEPPHSFAIAQDAYMKMRLDSRNQAVLISGESGAGKTEATKQCLNFLAEVAGSSTNVEQKILNANPVLEAFGNAKTLRNNNSSRFGKWMEVHFDTRGTIIGARINNYLLEKSRVVYQAQGERNYHIFYQLCASDLRGQLQLAEPETFRYLNQSGCTTVPGIDDLADLRDVRSAFSNLNFAPHEADWAFQQVAGILHLSNVGFRSDGDQGSVVDGNGMAWLQTAAHFLQVDQNTLAQSLITRSIEVRGDVTRILHKPNEAYDATDALCKALYNKLFDWLVERINQSLAGQRGNFIGILDIFGFEIFQKNSFEQLCINFTNEKLQQHFNHHTFKEEEQTYLAEGVHFDKVPFIDNQPVLDLIEKKPYGILNLLDEEVKLPQGGDDKWLMKCDSNQSAHPNWCNAAAQRTQLPPSSFLIQHYAGLVIYDSIGFCEKNKDSLFRDLYDLLAGSNHELTRQNFPPKDKNPRKLTTLGGEFRRQLNELMVVVDACEPHYIRCIKPNDEKRPNLFKTRMCIEQLTYAGVFEAVQIRKSGYPFRLTHKRFAARYRPLLRRENGWIPVNVARGDDRGMCQAILQNVNQDFSKVQIGYTMVMYRADEHRILELLRNLTLERVLPVAQRCARKYLGRKFRKAMRQAAGPCLEAIRVGNDVAHLDRAIQQSSNIMAPYMPVYNYVPWPLAKAKDLRFKLEERVKLTALYRQLVYKDAASCFGEFVDAIRRADKITDLPGTPEEMHLEQQVREMLANAAGAKIDPWAAEALYLLDRPQMEEVSAEAAKFGYSTPDLLEIAAKLALPEEEFVKQQLKRANEMNDPDRVINREVRLKELYLDSYGSMFVLDRCTILRDRVEWANSKFFGLALNKDELISGFLRHTINPIHQSLTVLDPGLAKEAVRQFKNIMGWMGDRKYQYPDTLAQEVLACGLQNSALRSELYCQLCKQLTYNPSQESLDRGWELMALMISCYPPPENFENYLAMFLRGNAPPDKKDQFILAMHTIIYGGSRSTPPSLAEIPLLIADFFKREVTRRFQQDDVVTVRTVQEPAAAASTSRGGVAAAAAPSSSSSAAAAQSYASPAAPMAPPPVRPAATPTAVALYDYLPGGQEGMLEMRRGDIITLLDTSDNDWWMGSIGHRQGWIPANYVKVD